MENKRQTERAKIRVGKCEETEQKLVNVFGNAKLSKEEILYVLALLHFDIGGSILGINSSIDCVSAWQMYAEKPSMATALLAHGADILYEWLKISELLTEKVE